MYLALIYTVLCVYTVFFLNNVLKKLILFDYVDRLNRKINNI